MRVRVLFCAALACLALPAVAQKVVLGKLGQAVNETKILSKPSGKARTYYKVKQFEYLVINAFNENYLKVLLQNGKQGYVDVDDVARLPYDVTADKPSAPTRDGAASLSSRSRAGVANYSLKFQGTPYVWGGNDPQAGIDCSAFVKFLYGQIGVKLPRTAAEQAMVGKKITRLEDLQPGDRLYFWSSKRNKVGHTGIYLGNGYFNHSSSNNRGVATDYLGNPKWRNILVAARR